MSDAPTWQEAMSRAAGLAALLPRRMVPLPQAVGATAAEDLATAAPLPHCDSSAMDGYALGPSGPQCSDPGAGPWRLDPASEVGAPHTASGSAALSPGDARPILTGGLLPAGAVAVIRAEYTRTAEGQLHLDAPDPAAASAELVPGRHIRRAGCEAPAGSVMAAAGTVLSPAHIAYLAIAGFDEVPVRRPPRVSVLATGDEVITQGLPGPGQVRDAFTPVMPAILSGLGAETIRIAHYDDDPAVLATALRAAVAASDLVITTGGTGCSGADAVRRVLATPGPLRCSTVFAEIAMRPGHPTLAVAAECPEGSRRGQQVPVIALPGNPLAAMVALRVAVQPVLEGMLGRHRHGAHYVSVAEDAAQAPAAGPTDRLVPARRDPEGTWRPCASARAHMLRGLTEAEGLLVVPRGGIGADRRTMMLELPW